MPINVACKCGRDLTIKNEFAGKRVRCPASKQPLEIPNQVEAVELACIEEDDESGCYAVNAEDARLEARPRGQGPDEVRAFAGTISRFKLSKHRHPVRCVAYSPDHQHAFAGLERNIHVLHVKSGKRAYKLGLHGEVICSGTFSHDGRLALAGDVQGDLLLWEVATARPLRWLDWHRAPVSAVAFAPTGGYAVSGDEEGFLCMWDLQDGQPIQHFGEEGAKVTGVSYTPDARHIVYATSAGRVRIWDVTVAQVVGRLRCGGNIKTVTVGAEGTSIVAAGREPGIGRPEFAVWQWALDDFKRLACLENPPRPNAMISCLALSSDGRRLLTGGYAMKSCDERGEQGSPWKNLPDLGAVNASLYRYELQVWSVASGLAVKTFEDLEWKIRCLAVSANGRRAISGDEDSTVMVWGLPA